MLMSNLFLHAQYKNVCINIKSIRQSIENYLCIIAYLPGDKNVSEKENKFDLVNLKVIKV